MTRVSVIGDALVLAATSEPGTLRDLAERAQVGYDSARANIPKLVAARKLLMVEEVRVPYRNRPVAVYKAAPPPAPPAGRSPVRAPGDDTVPYSIVDLQMMISGWPAR